MFKLSLIDEIKQLQLDDDMNEDPLPIARGKLTEFQTRSDLVSLQRSMFYNFHLQM